MMEQRPLDIVSLAKAFGFEDVRAMHPSAIRLYPEVRAMCAQNRCGQYAKSWSCPPACGELDAWETRIHGYRNGVLVQSVGPLDSPFDIEGMERAEKTHKARFLRFAREAASLLPDALPLGTGSCTLCKSCAYPDAPCRAPALRIVSMEACGIVVSEVCKLCDTSLWHGENTVAYAACLLF